MSDRPGGPVARDGPGETPPGQNPIRYGQAVPAEAGSSPRWQQRPLRALLDRALRLVPQLRPIANKLGWRLFYEVVSIRSDERSTTLINYGYAPLTEHAAPSDDSSFGLALYDAVVGEAEIADKQVLEVGCGRGEGTAHVFERYRPRSLTGVDIARWSIKRSTRRFARPGLSFLAADAEELPLPAGSFDAVINVESSHCYPRMDRFLAEVNRVLRPGGLLLLADFRPTASSSSDAELTDDIPTLRRQLAGAGFRTLEERDITAEVLHSLSLSTPAVRARIDDRVPARLRREALEFSGVEGSARFREFTEGKLTYMRFALAKA